MPSDRTSASGCGWGLFRRQPWSELDDYDRASPAVDCVLLTVEERELWVLVHQRMHEPFSRQWALPGAFVNFGARYEDEVLRALKDKAGVSLDCYLEQLVSWNAPDRDPRGWVTTVAYLALAPAGELHRQLDDDEYDQVCLARVRVPWRGEHGDPVDVDLAEDRQTELAFDHNTLIGLAVKRLRGKLRYSRVAFELLPETFTLRELQDVYEAILGRELNTDSFRRSVTETNRLVVATKKKQENVGHRPARLYRAAQD